MTLENDGTVTAENTVYNSYFKDADVTFHQESSATNTSFEGAHITVDRAVPFMGLSYALYAINLGPEARSLAVWGVFQRTPVWSNTRSL